MVLLRRLSSWFLISKRNSQVYQKDTLDLAIHSSCLKALNDGGRLRLNQVLSRESRLNHLPLTSSTPPRLARACGECFHWPMSLKHYKNLTWQTKGRHDQCTDSLMQSKTNGRYHAFAAPSPSRDWPGLFNPRRVSSGTELDNETNQDSKPPMFFLTAVTRNLAIARFLCEYSGPFWGMFSKIWLDIYIRKKVN